MRNLPLQRRTMALLAFILPLLALFVYVALRSGPLAPVAVTAMTVAAKPVTPSLFGIGIVEARYTYKIGPTSAGRVKSLNVQVGDRVKAGQVLGEMEPVDMDERIRAQDASLRHAEAGQQEAAARQTFAQTQARRYEQLFATHLVSEEIVVTRQQELLIANAALIGAREELARIRADRAAMNEQRGNLRLVAPVAGLVAIRHVDPGTTIVAGQPVVEVIDPDSLWINTRFDQISASGLAAKQTARILLHSRNAQAFTGHLLRIEPVADAVTEETLAKVVFDTMPEPFPAIGELAEVTVLLPTLAAVPVIPNAAVRREAGSMGVLKIVDNSAIFSPVTLGATDLDGNVQVIDGLKVGEQIIVYSEKALTARSRLKVVEKISGTAR